MPPGIAHRISRSPGRRLPCKRSTTKLPCFTRKGSDMRFLFYTHSLVSDWNHGNAHFLRGVMRELIEGGHAAVALEPVDGWSRTNLVKADPDAVARFGRDFPQL